MRRLRFFRDYGADPVWRVPDGTMANLDMIPVSPDRRQALRTWRECREALAWQRMAAEDSVEWEGI